MKRLITLGFVIATLAVVIFFALHHFRKAITAGSRVHAPVVHRAALFDTSQPLQAIRNFTGADGPTVCEDPEEGCGTSPGDAEEEESNEENAPAVVSDSVTSVGSTVEQTSQGFRPAAVLIDSFDGLGFGFKGPQGVANTRNPSDNSLAVGPNHIVQIVNSRMAVYTKKGAQFPSTGEVLYGPVVTNTIFAGFGGQCEHQVSGDAVVRYDQLADRWLYVLPIFRRPPDDPKGPYSMCYAVSTGPDPLGPYHRYEFKRPLFPDYPRPAVWPDGYYIPTSTGDQVIQKHACVADRNKMLKGLNATEQCVIIDGVNFLNNSDVDGQVLPPTGAPNLIMAAGGAQLLKRFEDDEIFVYRFHVDWDHPAATNVSLPVKIKVAPYHYLCNGQLTNCVSQPGTERHLDAQGDKLMQRLVYRNLGDHESIVALHSINTEAGGGGVRWYEFRLNKERNPFLYQQGTYAPDRFYRWMGSIGIDRQGNIGIGYSFGGAPNFAGQRFAARLEHDAPGQLTFHETVLAEGGAAQTSTLRWEDYATTAMDPSDNCTFWYVGDYLKAGAPSYTSKIGAFRLPGCLRGKISGTVYFDKNHNSHRDTGEPGLPGQSVSYVGSESADVVTDAKGNFSLSLSADPVYADTAYRVSQRPSAHPGWIQAKNTYSIHLKDGDDTTSLDFGNTCLVTNKGGRDPNYWTHGTGVKFWSKNNGKALLDAHPAEWTSLLGAKLYLANRDGSRFAVSAGNNPSRMLQNWLQDTDETNASHVLSVQAAVTALNVALGSQDGNVTVSDPIAGDWPTIHTVIQRVSNFIAAHSNTPLGSDRGNAMRYEALLRSLNRNIAQVTPSNPSSCRLARRGSN